MCPDLAGQGTRRDRNAGTSELKVVDISSAQSMSCSIVRPEEKRPVPVNCFGSAGQLSVPRGDLNAPPESRQAGRPLCVGLLTALQTRVPRLNALKERD